MAAGRKCSVACAKAAKDWGRGESAKKASATTPLRAGHARPLARPRERPEQTTTTRTQGKSTPEHGLNILHIFGPQQTAGLRCPAAARRCASGAFRYVAELLISGMRATISSLMEVAPRGENAAPIDPPAPSAAPLRGWPEPLQRQAPQQGDVAVNNVCARASWTPWQAHACAASSAAATSTHACALCCQPLPVLKVIATGSSQLLPGSTCPLHASRRHEHRMRLIHARNRSASLSHAFVKSRPADTCLRALAHVCVPETPRAPLRCRPWGAIRLPWPGVVGNCGRKEHVRCL